MVWSFSRVDSYHNCPKMFYLTYLEDDIPKVNNAFAQWGSFGHLLLEKYYKGKLELFELSDEYESKYKSKITIPFPNNKFSDLSISYWLAGKKYFDNFEDDFSAYEVVGVEKKIKIKIKQYDFIGYIDLILRDENGFYICDHKSKSKFKSKAEFEHYLYQLYIYSKYIYDTYGEYPKGLIFNMFRVGDIVKVDFQKADYDKAINWAITTIERIYNDNKFKDKIAIDYAKKKKKLKDFKHNDYFCNEICSVRDNCIRAKQKRRTKDKR